MNMMTLRCWRWLGTVDVEGFDGSQATTEPQDASSLRFCCFSCCPSRPAGPYCARMGRWVRACVYVCVRNGVYCGRSSLFAKMPLVCSWHQPPAAEKQKKKKKSNKKPCEAEKKKTLWPNNNANSATHTSHTHTRTLAQDYTRTHSDSVIHSCQHTQLIDFHLSEKRCQATLWSRTNKCA